MLESFQVFLIGDAVKGEVNLLQKQVEHLWRFVLEQVQEVVLEEHDLLFGAQLAHLVEHIAKSAPNGDGMIDVEI